LHYIELYMYKLPPMEYSTTDASNQSLPVDVYIVGHTQSAKLPRKSLQLHSQESALFERSGLSIALERVPLTVCFTSPAITLHSINGTC